MFLMCDVSGVSVTCVFCFPSLISFTLSAKAVALRSSPFALYLLVTGVHDGHRLLQLRIVDWQQRPLLQLPRESPEPQSANRDWREIVHPVKDKISRAVGRFNQPNHIDHAHH